MCGLMTNEKPSLRDPQIGQLAYYIANPKCLDTSDPGTGKTPPCCVYSYWHWNRNGKKTLWTMPKSLLKKNLKEMLRFTDFETKDVVILRTDRADLTKNWTGPTIQSTRRKSGFRCFLPDSTTPTDTIELRELAGRPVGFFFKDPQTGQFTPISGRGATKDALDLTKEVEVRAIFGPDGKPQKVTRDFPEEFKDLIADVKDAKVFICTFSFASTHWERLLKVNPDIDLLLVDELHMPGGYSTPSSKATESFYWINKHVSRFVGMTGTLINGRLDSAYPALSVIEPRYYGSLQGFMFEHAAVIDDYGRVVVWKNENKLKQIIEKHSIRRTFEEVYGKEPVVFFTEYVEVDEKVRVEYDKFHDQAMLELEDGRILDGSMPGVALIRARQLLSHPETMLKDIPAWTPKDERIQIHLSEGKKTLIYAALKPEQERLVRLCQSLGLRVGLINSDVTGRAREQVDEAAQRGELDVIVASGPTAAVGFNWEMFDLVIFASIDYMDTNVLQAYRRASRGSRTSILRVIFMRYLDSTDDRQYEIVKSKSQLANRVDPSRPVLEFSEVGS
jgi:hypothetical protein